jgi:hypothetical protein
MLPEEVERLRQQYTDHYVVADSERPELARFAGRKGQIKTINMNGRALVQFEGADRSWYDIDLAHLRFTEKPA